MLEIVKNVQESLSATDITTDNKVRRVLKRAYARLYVWGHGNWGISERTHAVSHFSLPTRSTNSGVAYNGGSFSLPFPTIKTLCSSSSSFFFFKSFFFSLFFSLSYFWYLNYRNHFHPLNRRHVLCICIRFVLVLFSKAACCTLFTITIIVGPWLSTKDSTTSRIIFFFSFFHFTLPSIKISFCVTVFLSPIIFFFFSVFCSFFFFSRSCSEWKTTEVEMTDWKSSIRRIIWHTSRWECTITMNNRERWVENSLLATHSVPNTWFVPENEKKIRTEENSIKYHFLYIDARNTWILLRSTTRSIS